MTKSDSLLQHYSSKECANWAKLSLVKGKKRVMKVLVSAVSKTKDLQNMLLIY